MRSSGRTGNFHIHKSLLALRFGELDAGGERFFALRLLSRCNVATFFMWSFLDLLLESLQLFFRFLKSMVLRRSSCTVRTGLRV